MVELNDTFFSGAVAGSIITGVCAIVGIFAFLEGKRERSRAAVSPSAGGSSETLAVERGDPPVSTAPEHGQPADSLVRSADESGPAAIVIETIGDIRRLIAPFTDELPVKYEDGRLAYIRYKLDADGNGKIIVGVARQALRAQPERARQPNAELSGGEVEKSEP